MCQPKRLSHIHIHRFASLTLQLDFPVFLLVFTHVVPFHVQLADCLGKVKLISLLIMKLLNAHTFPNDVSVRLSLHNFSIWSNQRLTLLLHALLVHASVRIFLISHFVCISLLILLSQNFVWLLLVLGHISPHLTKLGNYFTLLKIGLL